MVMAEGLAVQFHGSNVCSSFRFVRPETIRSNTSAKYAIGLTSFSFAVVAREQGIFARECIWPDRAFDHVRVHLDATVVQEHGQTGPMPDCIAHGLGQIRDGRDAPDMVLQPGV